MNTTTAQHQKQRPTEANTALNRNAMTLDEWRERVNVCHHIDDPAAFREEKAFLDAVGREKGYLGNGLSTGWTDHFYTLVGQLLRGRDPVRAINGNIILTHQDVLDKALENKERIWSAYRYAETNQCAAAAEDLKQAMRSAAMELVELYKEDLDIEGRAEQRGAA
ncbi:hypothetical protein NLU14_08820 [Marinobacter sp. 71-i]|uniref:Uncharacterized protein n=1 Tax=Marinobacter iranensis TaxID=2962607 RepID=A0ABT5Y9H7_9GAMM|nr:hypothetical protein [Marinobacter iranensis]MDF0750332.1 hypothetical protein [Marinobacter iranensis]